MTEFKPPFNSESFEYRYNNASFDEKVRVMHYVLGFSHRIPILDDREFAEIPQNLQIDILHAAEAVGV